MPTTANRSKRTAYAALAAGVCMTICGAAISSNPFVVAAIAAGLFFPLSWGIGEILSKSLRPRIAVRSQLFGILCATVAIGSFIYGAVDTGFRYGGSTGASWLILVGLVLLTLSAAAIPLSSAETDPVAPA